MTKQQTDVLIALTRSDYPRSYSGIAVELGIPTPSVRRTIGQLRKDGYPITELNSEGYFTLGAIARG